MPQTAYGVTLPIRRGNTGMFEQSTTLIQQVRSNFKNLMLTKTGERVMQPTFGTDLHKILFEQITTDTLDLARLTVVNAVERWMPFLELTNFNILAGSDNNPNQLTISCTYRFRNNPNVTDSITITV
jgi:phage baseplate assembly protein W